MGTILISTGLFKYQLLGCLSCKLKNGSHPGCAWKDDLSPLIDRILDSDALIIGTPIYWGEPAAQFRGLMERLVFCTMPYEAGSYFNGKVNVGYGLFQ